MEYIIDLKNEIELFDDNIGEKKLCDYIKKVVSNEYASKNGRDVYLSFYITDNSTIKEINKDHRGKDSATDVISFAYIDVEDDMFDVFDTLGDIVISYERVVEQSKEYNHSFEREFFYIVTHGLLHLLGYDHTEEEDKLIMRKKEEEILEKYGYRR